MPAFDHLALSLQALFDPSLGVCRVRCAVHRRCIFSFVSQTREHASSDSSRLRTPLPVSSQFAQRTFTVTITPTPTAVKSPTPTTISSTIAPILVSARTSPSIEPIFIFARTSSPIAPILVSSRTSPPIAPILESARTFLLIAPILVFAQTSQPSSPILESARTFPTQLAPTCLPQFFSISPELRSPTLLPSSPPTLCPLPLLSPPPISKPSVLSPPISDRSTRANLKRLLQT